MISFQFYSRYSRIGGKDSLVVWNELNSRYETHLLHVADGLYEFEDNWRLQTVLKTTERPYTVLKHDFKYSEIAKYASSTLRREGHPWAALCLFDALLVLP